MENYRSCGRLGVSMLLLLSALPAPFLFADSTGVVVSPTTYTATEGERVKFVASTLYNEVVTEGTTIVVSDDGSGLFYNGSISSGCSSTATPVTTKRFSIEKNKAFCYSNQAPGTYFITIELQDGEGAPRGVPAVAEVIVRASTTEQIIPETDIAIIKSVSHERPRVGETVTYTITVTNFGIATATAVTIEDILPTEVRFVAASPAPVQNSPLQWSTTELVSGETFVITLEGEVDNASAGLSLTNTATVTSDTKDSNPTNNTAAAYLYPQAAIEPEGDTYQLAGYVWHDTNQNGEFEGELSNENDDEKGLGGWVVTAFSGTSTVEAITDQTGKYSLTVTPGKWTITTGVLSGWERTTPESYVVVVPEEEGEEVASWSRQWWEYLVPVAEAALAATYSGYDFGLFLLPVPADTVEKTSGSKSAATRVKRPTADVLSLAEATATPLIAAGQVTIIPVGAPATGQGGTASHANTLSLHQLLYRESRRSHLL